MDTEKSLDNLRCVTPEEDCDSTTSLASEVSHEVKQSTKELPTHSNHYHVKRKLSGNHEDLGLKFKRNKGQYFEEESTDNEVSRKDNDFLATVSVDEDKMELMIRDHLLDAFHGSYERTDGERIETNNQAGSDKEKDKDQDRKIIIMKGKLPNLVLPEGWLALNHRSGGIIYLHRQSRVCTWGRPYHIGVGSVRKHDIPVAAIPCLHQKRALIKEASQIHNSQPNNSNKTVLNYLNTVSTTLEGEGASSLESDNQSIPQETMDESSHGRVTSDGLSKPANQPEDRVGSCGLGVVNRLMEENIIQSDGNRVDVQPVVREGKELIPEQESQTLVEGNETLASPCDDVSTLTTECQNTNNRVSEITNKQKENSNKQKENSNERSSEMARQSSIAKKTHLPDLWLRGTAHIPNNTYCKSGIELIDPDALSAYLSTIFEFQALTKEQEQNVLVVPPGPSTEEMELPPVLESLPFSVKGVDMGNNHIANKSDWVINPGGKTPVAILHEYAQRTLKVKPEYVCCECESPATPFMAEVRIDGITYGTGLAASKKQARQVAAEATLDVFMPGVFDKIRNYEISSEELQFFEEMNINDPKVSEVSVKAGLPSPSQILQECLKRNQGICSSTVEFKIIPGQNQRHNYWISCGDHTAGGLCKNKRIGKQLASQAILQKLHPHISTWGALLRIYCDRPSSVMKKVKSEDDLMTRPHNLPSDVPRGELLLDRLKEEMRKLHTKKETSP